MILFTHTHGKALLPEHPCRQKTNKGKTSLENKLVTFLDIQEKTIQRRYVHLHSHTFAKIWKSPKKQTFIDKKSIKNEKFFMLQPHSS